MPIQFDNYTPNKIENLKNHLSAMAAKGHPKHYEIFVDALKAVPKTDEPNEFDTYEDYMTPDTEQIRILIYNTNASPRNDQYVFILKAHSRDEANNMGLNGFTTKVFSKNSLSHWRAGQQNQSIEAKDFEINQLKKELSGVRKELEESEDYTDQLTTIIEKAKKNANKIGGIHWGEIASVAFEGFVRRNTKLIAEFPGGEVLAGLIEKDNERQAEDANEQPDTEVSFKKKTESTEPKKETSSEPVLTEKEKRFIGLMKELEREFSKEEMDQIITVLDYFSKDKSFLEAVLNEINGTDTEDEDDDEEEENKTENKVEKK